MRWNDHSKHVKEGDHAFLSASKYSWVHWSDDKLIENYITEDARKRGTELHEFACKCIKLKQKLPKSNKTLNMYVNDAIGFKSNTLEFKMPKDGLGQIIVGKYSICILPQNDINLAIAISKDYEEQVMQGLDENGYSH